MREGGNEIMEGEENVIRYTMEWTRVTSRSKPPSVEDRRNKGNGCFLNMKETDSRWELQSRWFASRSKPPTEPKATFLSTQEILWKFWDYELDGPRVVYF